MEKVDAELSARRAPPLRSAAFRRFVLANLVSATGSAMAPLALAYSVIGEGGGAGELGLVLATNTVPTVLFLLVGARTPAVVAVPLIVGATAARLLHAYGMLTARTLASGDAPPRLIGALGTYVFGVGLAIAAAASLL